MLKHFNGSLCKVETDSVTAVVKWKARVIVKFSQCNGGCATWFGSGDTIVIRRVDVQTVCNYADIHCDLRDRLLIRVPKQIGLRTREIATLQKEWINFETGSFQVLDSKKHKFYPLPLDMLTLQLIQDLTANFVNGLVFRHKTYKKTRQDQPLTNVAIWKVIRTIGEKAGVKGFHPRILRHYFAAHWIYDQGKSIETLRRILRHKNLEVTHRYLARLVFFEDVQKKYNEVKNPYIVSTENDPANPSTFCEEYCGQCVHESICKFKDSMCSCQAVSGCRFYEPKKEEMQKI